MLLRAATMPMGTAMAMERTTATMIRATVSIALSQYPTSPMATSVTRQKIAILPFTVRHASSTDAATTVSHGSQRRKFSSTSSMRNTVSDMASRKGANERVVHRMESSTERAMLGPQSTGKASPVPMVAISTAVRPARASRVSTSRVGVFRVESAPLMPPRRVCSSGAAASKLGAVPSPWPWPLVEPDIRARSRSSPPPDARRQLAAAPRGR